MEFKYNCQALRQLEIEKDIDDIITFFYLEVDNRPEPEIEKLEDPEAIQRKKEEDIQKVIDNKPIMHTELD